MANVERGEVERAREALEAERSVSSVSPDVKRIIERALGASALNKSYQDVVRDLGKIASGR